MESALAADIVRAAGWMSEAFDRGGQCLLCGTGVSRGRRAHIAGELVGRFLRDAARCQPSASCEHDGHHCHRNDYSYEMRLFTPWRHMAGSGDVFVGITTSGNRENILRAAAAARGQASR
jgi:D-sedoheptulose 7-phosphate isomerase